MSCYSNAMFKAVISSISMCAMSAMVIISQQSGIGISHLLTYDRANA